MPEQRLGDPRAEIVGLRLWVPQLVRAVRLRPHRPRLHLAGAPDGADYVPNPPGVRASEITCSASASRRGSKRAASRSKSSGVVAPTPRTIPCASMNTFVGTPRTPSVRA